MQVRGVEVHEGHRQAALDLVRVFGIKEALEILARWEKDDPRYGVVIDLIRGVPEAEAVAS